MRSNGFENRSAAGALGRVSTSGWILACCALCACAGGVPSEPSAAASVHGDPASLALAVVAQAAAASGDVNEDPAPSPSGDPNPAPALVPVRVPTVPLNHAVGTRRIELLVNAERRIPVQLWYPAVESARAQADGGRPVLDFEPPGKRRDQLRRLTDRAGTIYSQRTMHAADAPAVFEQATPFPLVLISHCNDCTRFTYFELAERLAKRGFVVAAPDHVNNTLYNYVEGNSVGLDLNDFLDTRRLDIKGVTDALLDANASAIPEGLRGKIDPARIGMAGHSFGALTTAYASTVDTRLRAVAFLAMIASLGDNLPALGDQLAQRVKPVKFSKPAFFLLATEDAINVGGLDDMIRQNYLDYPKETWLVSMKDGGHYSVTNICGIDPLYTNGCGTGIRASQLLVPFTYLDIDRATALTAQLVTTYFEQQLNGWSGDSLEAIVAGQAGVLTLEHRKPD